MVVPPTGVGVPTSQPSKCALRASCRRARFPRRTTVRPGQSVWQPANGLRPCIARCLVLVLEVYPVPKRRVVFVLLRSSCLSLVARIRAAGLSHGQRGEKSWDLLNPWIGTTELLLLYWYYESCLASILLAIYIYISIYSYMWKKERKKERTNERKKERKEGRKKERKRERERVTIDAITHVDVHACVRKDYIHVLKIENFTDWKDVAHFPGSCCVALP